VDVVVVVIVVVIIAWGVVVVAVMMPPPKEPEWSGWLGAPGGPTRCVGGRGGDFGAASTSTGRV
jgi:hypothetical protein